MQKCCLILVLPTLLAFTTQAAAFKCHVPALSKRGECYRTQGGKCNPMTGKWEPTSNQMKQACLATGSGRAGQ
jgi:hypothetical protein